MLSYPSRDIWGYKSSHKGRRETVETEGRPIDNAPMADIVQGVG